MKLVFAVILVIASSQAYSQRYYPLICKGGPSVEFGAYSLVKYAPNNASYSAPKWYQVMYFKSASGPADPSGRTLNEGECSFTDRALRSQEPRKLLIDEILIELEVDAEGKLTSSTRTSRAMQRPGQVRTFAVRNFEGYLRVRPDA